MHLDTLEYIDNVIEKYRNLAHLPGFVLLHSSDKNNGRYDILSAYPYDYFTIDEHETHVAEKWQSFTRSLCFKSFDLALPFQGGAIGYVSYDFGARLVNLRSPVREELIGMPLVHLGLYDWAIIVDHVERTVSLFNAEKCHDTKKILSEIKSLWSQASTLDNESSLMNPFTPLMSKQDYQLAYEKVQAALKAGRSYQVNLTQSFQARYQGDSWGLYEKICQQNPVPYAAFLRMQDIEILSFSPERFLKYHKDKMLTSPIKGSIKRSSDVTMDALLKAQLSACPKNRAENTMIVDLLRNDLGKIAKPGTVHVKNLCAVHSFNSVHHLISDIEAQCLDGLNPLEAFMSCFPGGSITGAPKLESMRIIHELEPYARGVYCGSIAYFSNHRRFDSSIAIRTMVARKGLLHLAAGGGIVIDSNCDEEYAECFTKTAAVTLALR